MPYYRFIKSMTKQQRLRTLAGLDRLRRQLDDRMPEKTRNATLVLGTWNIRNFDDNRFMSGHRTDEDLYYLAEIISRFDILAIQEVCDDLSPLNRLMHMLGTHFDYIITDITEGRSGNNERIGFIYDRAKVSFLGEAGEIVLPDRLQIISGANKRQFSRTPFMCSFQAGWFKFFFSSVHIYFGAASGVKYERRVKEINSIAKFLAKRAKKDDQNHILVGDFNIVGPGSMGYNALQKNGFEIFQNNKGSNKDQTKFYDQISFRARKNELRLYESDKSKGVLQFFESIYRSEDFSGYKSDLLKTVKAKIAKIEFEIAEDKRKMESTSSETRKVKLQKSIRKREKSMSEWQTTLTDDNKLKEYYMSDWRTFHGSDHLPLWVELEIDFSDEYLKSLHII